MGTRIEYLNATTNAVENTIELDETYTKEDNPKLIEGLFYSEDHEMLSEVGVNSIGEYGEYLSDANIRLTTINPEYTYWVDETETFYDKENETTKKHGFVKYIKTEDGLINAD